MEYGSHWHGTWSSAEEGHSRGDYEGIIQIMLLPASSEPLFGQEDESLSLSDTSLLDSATVDPVVRGFIRDWDAIKDLLRHVLYTGLGWEMGNKGNFLFTDPKQQERAEAKNLFATEETEEEIKRESAKTFVPVEIPTTQDLAMEEQTPKPVAPTLEQTLAIKAAILNSQTLEEVAKLEQALKSGQLPADGDNAPKSESAQHDNMITDEKEVDTESKDSEPEQKRDEPAEMEEAHATFLVGKKVVMQLKSLTAKPMLTFV